MAERYGSNVISACVGSRPHSTLSNSSWALFWISGKVVMAKMKVCRAAEAESDAANTKRKVA